MSRINRIALRLISQLEDLYIKKGGNLLKQDDYAENADEYTRIRHQKVAELDKTKQKLERWFAARNIPIRIVYANSEHASVIPKPGVITLRYDPILGQEPPTAWIIVHNLAHGIFDFIQSSNPHLFQNKVRERYWNEGQNMMQRMQLGFNRGLDERYEEELSRSGVSVDPNTIYPTTRSEINNAITDSTEAFYEIFTDWVRTGRVQLHSKNQSRAQEWEKKLERYFRQVVGKVARMGVVIHNV